MAPKMIGQKNVSDAWMFGWKRDPSIDVALQGRELDDQYSSILCGKNGGTGGKIIRLVISETFILCSIDPGAVFFIA